MYGLTGNYPGEGVEWWVVRGCSGQKEKHQAEAGVLHEWKKHQYC